MITKISDFYVFNINEIKFLKYYMKNVLCDETDKDIKHFLV